MCRAKRGRQWGRPKIRREIVLNDGLNIYIYIYNVNYENKYFSKYKKLYFSEGVKP